MNPCTLTSFLVLICSRLSSAQEAVVTVPPKSVNISLNSVAEFDCTGVAAIFTWNINGVQVISSNDLQIITVNVAQGILMSTLRMTVSSTNALNITCEAIKQPPSLSKNESQPALLLVQGLLESVSNLAVTPVNSTTILISWSPPFTLEGVPILGYNVTITTSGENETMSVEGDTTMLYYSIDHFKSTFTITVVPINMVGAGDKASMPYSTITTSSTSQPVVLSVSTAISGTPAPLPRAGDNLAGIVGGTVAGAVIIAALIVTCIGVYCVCKRRNPNTVAKPQQTHYNESSFPLNASTLTEDGANTSKTSADVPDSKPNKVAVTHECSETVLDRFASDRLILPRDDIKRGKKTGNGHFGGVYKASLVSSNQRVAVKACKTSHSDAVKCHFLYEADILRHYKHPNIVKLIGVVRRYEKEPLCIVMEYVGWTFEYFLRANGSKCETEELTKMCVHVCTGMEYLERNNCVHRSLTARNCLVGENNIVKISNFGTSHGRIHLDPSDSKLRPAPIKWTAPEALMKNGTYTSASDVWSFGILLWEVFSLGAEPYPGIARLRVRGKVKKGYRMDPPADCPPLVYDVMKKCWEYESSDRPTFTELLDEMREM